MKLVGLISAASLLAALFSTTWAVNENGNNGNNGNSCGTQGREDVDDFGGRNQLFGDFDINDDVTCVCNRLPSDAELASYTDFYTLSGCSRDDNSAACSGGAHLDLTVLTSHIQCFKTACEESSECPKQGALKKCVRDMRDVIYNFLQFSVPDPQPRQQLERSCECDYASLPDRDIDGFCELNHAGNCDPTSTDCLNANWRNDNKECCRKEGAERATCFAQVGEVIKLGRIYMYCSVDLKSMLKNENIGNVTCQETKDYKDSLLESCGNNCLLNLASDWSEDDAFTYTNQDDYTNEWVCGSFQEELDGTTFDFLGDSVYYKGRREVWRQSLDICVEYKTSGDLPDCMRASPYVRPFLTHDQMKKVVGKCCKESKEDYLTMQSTRDSNPRDLSGLREAICLNDGGIMNDFGFSSGLLRSVVKKATDGCWDCIPGKCSPNSERSKVGTPCNGLPIEQPKMCDYDTFSPKSIYWFLRYLNTAEEKAYALKACAYGARFGKTITAFNGVAIGLESQVKALGSDYPIGYKAIAFMAMHHCGVTASLEANNYFEAGAECNPHALPINKRETC